MSIFHTKGVGVCSTVPWCRECSHLLELLLQLCMLPCFPGFHPQLVTLLLQALRLLLQHGLLLLCCNQEALLLLVCSLEGLELFRQPRVSIWIMVAGSPARKSQLGHSSRLLSLPSMEGMLVYHCSIGGHQASQ